jgi:hypothetical protein
MIMRNPRCLIEYNTKQNIISGAETGNDLNASRFYTTSKRGLKKAHQEMLKVFDEHWSVNRVAHFLREHGISTHTYCAAD